jgi:1,4-dihydroxy-2-naphthoate polyprenyltransferase
MTFPQLLGIVELRTKLVSLSTLAAATIFAWREAGRLDALTLALTLPAVLLVDMGTTAFDSFFDYLRGVDDRARVREADKVLVTEGVPPLAALIVAAACYFIAGLFGLVLAFRAGSWVAFAGAACMAAGFLYSGGPAPLSRSPLGELLAGGFLGTALFLIAFRLQAGYWDGRALLASLPLALSIAAILAVNNACDIEGDRAAGRRTLAVLLGPRAASFLPPLLAASAYASLALLGAAGLLHRLSIWIAAGGAIASVPVFASMLRRGFSHATKGESMRGILFAFAIASGASIAAIGGQA